MIRDEMKESQEKERKKENLIIYNVPESDAQEAENRINEDKNWCKKIFIQREGLGLDLHEEDTV